jgi:hypothetical protein
LNSRLYFRFGMTRSLDSHYLSFGAPTKRGEVHVRIPFPPLRLYPSVVV